MILVVVILSLIILRFLRSRIGRVLRIIRRLIFSLKSSLKIGR